MKRRMLCAAAAGLGLMLAGTGLKAQAVTLELRGTGVASVEDLAGAELSAGFGGGGTVAFRFMPHVAAYGGWDWLRFHAEESFAGSHMAFEETGYAVGLRFEHPFGRDPGELYRVEVGGTFRHVEVVNEGGDLIADSGHEPGFEMGGGIILPLGESWRLSPTARFRSLGPEFTIEGETTPTVLRYAGVEIALSYRF